MPDRYHERQGAIPDYLEVVRTVVGTRPGVYALYVSSHAFLEDLLPHLKRLDVALHVQSREMDDRLRAALLQRLCRGPMDSGDTSRLLVAVLGGSFAEGIECPPGVLSGVIVLGPGLPTVGVEQELLRAYFEERFGTGFAYAYVYPGMTRVIQAAGRLIRRASDRGCVVLVGERFLEWPYAKVIPRYWYPSKPSELSTDDLRSDLEAFWHTVESFDDPGRVEPGAGASGTP